MGRGKHKPWSYQEKKKRYKARREQEGYPKGGYNKVPDRPYAPDKRR